jgi:hypothetical protein
MSISLGTGVQLLFASQYDAPIAVTALSNANPAQATVPTGHGLVVGDFVEANLGWSLATDKVYRVIASDATTVDLEGLDSSEDLLYTPGGGTGTLRKIVTWQNITQVRELAQSGGEPKYADISTIDNPVDRQMPSGFSAVTYTITVYDDPTQQWAQQMQKLTDKQQTAAFQLLPKSQAQSIAVAYWSLAPFANFTRGEATTITLSLTLVMQPIRFLPL